MVTPSALRSTAVALITATIVLFGLVERYEVIGAQLLIDPDFVLDTNAWEAWRKEGTIERSTGMISLDGTGGFTVVRQNLAAPDAQGLRLVTEQRLVQSGAAGDGMARVLVLSYAGRARWDLPFGSLVADRDGQWRQSAVDVPLDPGVTGLTVFLQNLKVAGALEVRRVELYPLQERWRFGFLSTVLLGGWLGFGGLCVVSLMRAGGGKGAKLLVIAVSLLIVAGTLMPKQRVRAVTHEVRAVSSQVTGSTPEKPSWFSQFEPSQNSMHVVLFALFVFVLCWWRPRMRLGELATAVLLFAASTELLQFFALYRQPGLDDLGRDLFGALIGLAAGLMMLGWGRGEEDAAR
jgi:hypothetical protein